MLGLAYRILGSRAEAEDVVQELFIKWLEADRAAIASGSTASLTAMLSEDVELYADSGGKASAIRETLSGISSVLDFIGQSLHAYWQTCEWLPSEINGAQGVIIKADGVISALMTFGFDEAGRVSRIFIMRNPEKLAGLRDMLDVQ